MVCLYTHNIQAPYDTTGCITIQENTAPCHLNIRIQIGGNIAQSMSGYLTMYTRFFTIEKTKGFYDLRNLTTENSLH